MPTTDAVLAHPVFEHTGGGLPPLLLASVAAWLVFLVAFALPERTAAARAVDGVASLPDTSSWYGRLSTTQLAGRVVAVVLLAVAIAAARLGADDQLENLAPALVVGTAWPLLVLACVTVGPVWRWVDPWDGLARLGGGASRTPPSPDRAAASDDTGPAEEPARRSPSVWPAVLPALGWVWFLSATPDPLDPRAVGVVLTAYTVLTVAGCVAVGREQWLSRAEPLGILLSWLAMLPRGRLAAWEPPRGAEALLAVVIGGVSFGAIRRSQQWTGVDAATGAWAYATGAVLASCALVLLLLLLSRRIGRRVGGEAGVARAVVPVAAAVVLAVSLGRNRLTNSVQLLPGLLGDPFGEGWDLLGPALDGLDAAPLGVDGLLAAQVAVLVAGHLVGAVVAGWWSGRQARMPATIALAVLMALTTVAVPAH